MDAKFYKKVLDGLDDLMIALSKQKHLGLDAEVVKALKSLTVARNAFKREYIKQYVERVPVRNETVFTNFLDEVGKNV